MELNFQYTSNSAKNLSLNTLADPLQTAHAQRGQPRIFTESGIALRSTVTRDDQKHATADQKISRKERGAVLGACAKSEFRECRGGDALAENSSGHEGFDQFDRKETRGDNGRGTCDGIVRTLMFDADRHFGSAGGDLPSLVKAMRAEMDSRRASASGGVFDRIRNNQENQTRAMLLPRYAQVTNTDLTPPGTPGQSSAISSEVRLKHREARVAALNDNIANLPQAGLAYIRTRIQDSEGHDKGGHVLLAQRLPLHSRAGGDAPAARYAIFDPNNGVFTYNSLHDMQTALEDYMDSAYNEDGYLTTPEQLTMYRPLTSQEYTATPVRGQPVPDMTMPPAGPTVPCEPPELSRRPHLGRDHSDL